MSSEVVLVTGGAGFIGSALIRYLVRETDVQIVNVDKLTYAGSLGAVAEVSGSDRYTFERVDICDQAEIARVFEEHNPTSVIHLAAETHVDRSIDGPGAFVQSNTVGTYVMLDAALKHWRSLPDDAADKFRFLHVSTDEVFGSLGAEGQFTESSPYAPRSPYSATKAAADHLARAWHETYSLPVLLTNCSNNYGPFQFAEKLIPLMTIKALAGEPLPVYGTGANVRDWLHVDDHARALWQVTSQGRIGESYNIGANSERTNLQVVEAICDALDELAPEQAPHREQITFVEDRPGHDQRYAIDAQKIRSELGWQPGHDFDSGLRATIEWYLEHRNWWENPDGGVYSQERLGSPG